MRGVVLRQLRDAWVRLDWRGSSPITQAHYDGINEIPGAKAFADHRGGYIELHESCYELPIVYDALAACRVLAPVPRAALTQRWKFPEGYFDNLLAHQRDAVMWLMANRGGLLADDMGLGKTRSGAYAAAALVGEEVPRLILGPLFVRDTWRRELLRCGLARDESDFAALEGFDSSSEEFTRARWWFCHYDIISKWHTRLNFNRRGRAGVAIVDEAHYVSNGLTRRGKGTLAACGTIPNRIVMTGTPMADRPTDLWALLTLVDGPGAWGHAAAFRERYSGAVRTDYGLKDGEPSNVEELQKRMRYRFLRRVKSEVGLNLPPMTRSSISTSLGATAVKKQHALLHKHEITMERLTQMLLSGGLSDETLKLLHQLRQLSSEAKLPTTVEYLENALDHGSAVVVFATERVMVDKLWAEVDRAPRYTVHGGQSIEQRDATVAEFQGGSGPALLVATYGALREGVTLTRANTVVLHDLGWVPDELLQAEARVHRIGAREPVQSVWSVAERSIDTIFARVLEAKATRQNYVLNMDAATNALTAANVLGASGAPTIQQEVDHLFATWR